MIDLISRRHDLSLEALGIETQRQRSSKPDWKASKPGHVSGHVCVLAVAECAADVAALSKAVNDLIQNMFRTESMPGTMVVVVVMCAKVKELSKGFEKADGTQ